MRAPPSWEQQRRFSAAPTVHEGPGSIGLGQTPELSGTHCFLISLPFTSAFDESLLQRKAQSAQNPSVHKGPPSSGWEGRF